MIAGISHTVGKGSLGTIGHGAVAHLNQALPILLSNVLCLLLIAFAMVSIVIGPRRAWQLAGTLGKRLGRGLAKTIMHAVILAVKKLVVYLLKGILSLILQLRVRKTIH